MTAISEMLSQISNVEAAILAILVLTLSYFFLRSGHRPTTSHMPVASSAPPDSSLPPKPFAMEPPPPSMPVASVVQVPPTPAPSHPLQSTPVGPATREYMELLARMLSRGEAEDEPSHT